MELHPAVVRKVNEFISSSRLIYKFQVDPEIESDSDINVDTFLLKELVEKIQGMIGELRHPEFMFVEDIDSHDIDTIENQLNILAIEFECMRTDEIELFLGIHDVKHSTDIVGNIRTAKSGQI